jgi:hypothetical protein
MTAASDGVVGAPTAFNPRVENTSSDGWRPGGRTVPTSGPGVGLRATDKWATVFDFPTQK